MGHSWRYPKSLFLQDSNKERRVMTCNSIPIRTQFSSGFLFRGSCQGFAHENKFGEMSCPRSKRSVFVAALGASPAGCRSISSG